MKKNPYEVNNKNIALIIDDSQQKVNEESIKDFIIKSRSLAKNACVKIKKNKLLIKESFEKYNFKIHHFNEEYWELILNFNVSEFSSKRLLLKAVTINDISSYEKHFVHYEIIRYLSSAVPWPYPKNGVKDFLENFVFPYQGDDFWLWGIFLKNKPQELIGAIHLWREAKPENRGFWISQEHQNKGLMTEAIKPIMDHAFKDLGFEKLIFTNALGNSKSRRIKEKTKATLLRVEPMTFVDPKFTEHEIWELKKEDWFKV